jgi:uncharacterized protein (DUF433 family)
MTSSSHAVPEPWRNRLKLPNYQVAEAARYAGISPQTVVRWHHATLSPRDSRRALSYLQLIEVAVVAEFRKAGVSLGRVKEARDYIKQTLGSNFPFAEYRFKTDGKKLLLDYENIIGKKGKGKLLEVNLSGQLAWSDILGRLKQFNYEDQGVVIQWYVDGRRSPILIDPRIAFGAPAVQGTPTWIIKGRWEAGETSSEIADDFGLTKNLVEKALKFEGIDPDNRQNKTWH